MCTWWSVPLHYIFPMKFPRLSLTWFSVYFTEHLLYPLSTVLQSIISLSKWHQRFLANDYHLHDYGDTPVLTPLSNLIFSVQRPVGFPSILFLRVFLKIFLLSFLLFLTRFTKLSSTPFRIPNASHKSSVGDYLEKRAEECMLKFNVAVMVFIQITERQQGLVLHWYAAIQTIQHPLRKTIPTATSNLKITTVTSM